MILNNKMFKLSSLCIIGTMAIVMNQVISSNASLTTVSTGSSDAKSSNVVENNDSQEDTTGSLTYTAVVENGEVTVKEEEVPTAAEAEEETKKEEAIAVENAFLEGPVAGVNYNDYIKLENYKNISFNTAGQYLNVRKAAGKDKEIVGKMPPNAGATILEEVKDAEGADWCKVKSGDVTGYVAKQYLTTGEDALAMVKDAGRLVVKVDCDILNIREKASTESEVLYQISKGEELDIISIENDWIKVGVDVGQDFAYVAKEYVKVTFELYKAIEIDELLYGCSSERIAIVNMAKRYLGNRYVYGGTSLENGIDCSGFMMRIYEKFGYSITRTSRSQATQGKQISSSELKPGDLVFYGRGSSVSSIYHVAMFIGNGKIIHASNPRSGIKISNMNYTTPCRYVSILND